MEGAGHTAIEVIYLANVLALSGLATFRIVGKQEVMRLLPVCPSSGRRRQRASKSGLSMFGLLDYRGWPRRRLHSPRAERMKVKPPSPPSAQSVQTKKKPPVDLAISP
jgi:hypothetical protein